MKNVVDILQDLIAIPSVNPMGRDELDSSRCGEARINTYLSDFIEKAGLIPLVQKTAIEHRDNVGAMIYRGEKYKTIILQCHTDTVGIGDNEKLLLPAEKNGKIYGRGACDCKGGLAAMFAALAEAATRPEQVKNNVIVMGVSDEEYSFRGSLALGEQEPTKNADFGIIGEPTECRIVNGFKGVARWDLSVTGKAFHSSEPEKGINAIFRMAKIVNLIEKYQSGLNHGETISVGRIKGGAAVNIVPDSCTIEIDRRLTKAASPQDAFNALKKYLSEQLDFAFSFSDLKDAQHAVLVDGRYPGVKMLSAICAEMNLDAIPRQVAFGSDAFRMNAAGIPTVLWGPGSIANAHTDSEFVKIDELKKAKDFYLNIMKNDLRNHN
ncbi:MAG: M20/M25/M40 family metallo-hydrolase [Victivallaceae bacterium]|nr:M20/M25/M40 family metallo-hydrolase [Victivallaceae bacterium]